MTVLCVVAVVSCVAAAVLGHRAGVRQGGFNAQFDCEQRLARANGLFSAADAELNALKIQHSQTLMELENAKRDITLLTRH